eukprot:COSAG01_NODE_52068_length_349_cov_1.076000_1_plen_76_part_10
MALALLLWSAAATGASDTGGGGEGGRLHFASSVAGPDLSLLDAVLSRSWAGVLQFDLFGDHGGAVALNSSDCLGHC